MPSIDANEADSTSDVSSLTNRKLAHDSTENPDGGHGGHGRSEFLTNRERIGYDSLLQAPPGEGTPEGNESEPFTQPAERRRSAPRLWAMEIFASILSTASLAAVIVVLWVENGRPLEQWAWSIGPTAVVSFIATVSRASLLLAVTEAMGQLKWMHFYGRANPLFDLQLFDASVRGPLGAAKLIWWKNIKALLASFASVLIIVSVLVDPFMQLVFDFPALARPQSGMTGSVRRTDVYDPSGWNIIAVPIAAAIDATMQAAIISAASDTRPIFAASCSTGNCTWSGITTLGVCSSCSNVTTQVSLKCPAIPSDRDEQFACDYYFPSGHNNLSAFSYNDEDEPVLHETGLLTRWNSSATPLFQGRPDSDATLVSFNAIQLKSHVSEYVAWSCSMSFCAKTYDSVNVTNGVAAASSPRATPLHYIDYSLVNGRETLDTLRDSGNGSGTEYTVNELDWNHIAQYLAELFSTGWGTVRIDPTNKFRHATSPNLGWEFANSGNLSATVANIAESMTEVIRTGGNSTSETVAALHTRTYIQVSFKWLALPIAVTVLGLGFVVWVVVEAGKSGVPVLKNSSLALLAYQVDGWAPESVLSRGDHALKEEAKAVQVTLPKETRGAEFVRVKGG
ncbi:hypothetical protein EKO27_g4377 [Xylaria grammica]|uniref:Uncharacterized protein n=1 Tax=Xylaria grammica TaxID=363999 RepID=A0A439D8K5_9PEZI|nr:hypothetical protein EKO27_g4377 [Xylaria grammica]